MRNYNRSSLDLAPQIAAEVAKKLRSDYPFSRPWLSPDEAAEYLRLSRRGLEQMRARGAGPKYSKVGRIVRYQRSDLDGWLKRSGE